MSPSSTAVPSPIEISDVALPSEAVEAACGVLESGQLRQGPECAAFEAEFAAQTDAVHAISCASGTAALHLAYLSFLSPGDEVLVPSFTFFATASTVALAGGTPIFCDVDPHTFLLDLDGAQKRLTDRTRAIGPVHLFGNPCDIAAVQEFTRQHDLTIVWDAAQAHGATHARLDVGSCRDFVCYSFYPTKNVFVGEGGMICTPDPDRAARLRLLRDHGQSAPYLHTELGLNYRMTDVEAAIGRVQLRHLNGMNEKRRRIAEILREGIATVPGLTTQAITPGGEHAWHQFCILVDPGKYDCDRDTLAVRLRAQKIGTAVHYPRGLHQQPVFQGLAKGLSLPNTEYLCKHILALPVHPGVSEADAERIVEALSEGRRNGLI